MQYRAMACSATLLLGILNLVNSSFNLITLPSKPTGVIMIIWTISYIVGFTIIDRNKSKIEQYDRIKGKEKFSHIIISIASIALIIWLFNR